MKEHHQLYALFRLPLSKRRDILGKFYGKDGSDFERAKAGVIAARQAGKLKDILAAVEAQNDRR